MNATITVKMDNAAFEEPTTELIRILNDIIAGLESGLPPEGESYKLRDINGNRVGEFVVTGQRN